MKLETKRLILRKPRKSDWKDIVEGINDLNIAKYLVKVPFPYKKNDAEEYIIRTLKNWAEKEKEKYSFLIELKSEKKVIGGITLHNLSKQHKTAMTGAWINKKFQRKGYITEAKIILHDFAFKKLKLRKIETEVSTKNKSSNAAIKKLGFKLEGVSRKTAISLADGEIFDNNCYGLLKEEWIKIRPKLVRK